jgi:hypothetical protein
MADVIRAWLKNPIGLTTAQVLYLHAQKVFRGRSFAPDPHCGMEIEIAPDPSFPSINGQERKQDVERNTKKNLKTVGETDHRRVVYFIGVLRVEIPLNAVIYFPFRCVENPKL